MLANSANAILVYLALHGYLLHKYGQTIGKAEFGMRIEMLNGEKASLQHIVLWRYLPVILMSFVPVIGQWLTGLDATLWSWRAAGMATWVAPLAWRPLRPLLELGYRLFCRLRPHLDWLPHPDAGQRCKDKTCSSHTQP